MRRTPAETAWVVYRMTLRGEPFGGNIVCEQREWDALTSANPHLYVLVRAGIGTEQEAEKLARGTAGDTYRKGSGKKPPSPGQAPPAVVPPGQTG